MSASDEKYYLFTEPTGLSARQLADMIGANGIETPLGPMVQAPRRFDLNAAMAKLDRALHPHRCHCGTMLAGFHAKWCPAYGHDHGGIT